LGKFVAKCLAPERNTDSFRLGLQLRQGSIQLVFGNSFPTVELIDAAPNLGIDRFPVLHKPAILFFLGFPSS